MATSREPFLTAKLQGFGTTIFAEMSALAVATDGKARFCRLDPRTGAALAMQAGRDITWSQAIAGQADTCEPEWVGAEHPLFILYTSGSTGKPKGVQHSTGGYLLHAILRAQPRRTGNSDGS